MNIEKLIKERHSVRSYLSKEIEQDKLEVLNKLIDDINNEYDLNIQLITNDKNIFDNLILHYGRIKKCDNYIALVGKESKDLDLVEDLIQNGPTTKTHDQRTGKFFTHEVT